MNSEDHQEIRNLIGSITNRCNIIEFILTYPCPVHLENSIYTLLEDIAEDVQELTDRFRVERSESYHAISG